ncbi:unnamed protein product [Prorocentrum cordatum]|uniref:PIN domain-containing protein n=1 Tax=Prorocentrum cordatum TaxID=2364126 RepID=A0ABN9TSI5_9DINO|nr:unnamed protein product [Polarella glacialis]
MCDVWLCRHRRITVLPAHPWPSSQSRFAATDTSAQIRRVGSFRAGVDAAPSRPAGGGSGGGDWARPGPPRRWRTRSPRGRRGLAGSRWRRRTPIPKSKGVGKGKGRDADRVEQVAIATAKLTMIVATDAQNRQAAVYEAWELEASKPMAEFAVQAGQKYDADAKELKKKHAVDSQVDTGSLRPPHLVIAAAAIKGISTLVTEDSEKVPTEFWTTVVRQEGPEFLGSCITHFQAKKNKAPNKKEKQHEAESRHPDHGAPEGGTPEEAGLGAARSTPARAEEPGAFDLEIELELVGEAVPRVQTRGRPRTPQPNTRRAPNEPPTAFRESRR